MNVQILFLTASVGYICGCPLGYFGQNCEHACRHPSYGKDCQSLCICAPEICNHSTGCPDGTVTKEFNYQHSTFPTINDTTLSKKKLEILYISPDLVIANQKDFSSGSSLWTPLNTTHRVMFVSVVIISAVLLILTGIYIRIKIQEHMCFYQFNLVEFRSQNRNASFGNSSV
ncbi:uncharacterized protein LOC125674673 [Ostrea edulis]|uniref:uncharacterized protein LOC125674673 n=1 Tax=Ostrea edulis TaxID=37623 RepID=UPI0024AF17DE|nr:uncharacterized protein LOC125674673 [Ostrea edulis]